MLQLQFCIQTSRQSPAAIRVADTTGAYAAADATVPNENGYGNEDSVAAALDNPPRADLYLGVLIDRCRTTSPCGSPLQLQRETVAVRAGGSLLEAIYFEADLNQDGHYQLLMIGAPLYDASILYAINQVCYVDDLVGQFNPDGVVSGFYKCIQSLPETAVIDNITYANTVYFLPLRSVADHPQELLQPGSYYRLMNRVHLLHGEAGIQHFGLSYAALPLSCPDDETIGLTYAYLLMYNRAAVHAAGTGDYPFADQLATAIYGLLGAGYGSRQQISPVATMPYGMPHYPAPVHQPGLVNGNQGRPYGLLSSPHQNGYSNGYGNSNDCACP